MEIRLNKETVKDKILACWIGKNIGGTMGAPFEGTRDLLDIKGYTSPKGEPLPNDDLDLQLIWLTAMEQLGPYSINAAELSDYWLSFITPHWNEYGVGKSNLRLGLLPPLSGACSNNVWATSNGAWIRSEIWACMAPGFPNIAVKYAIMDACIDHGISDGTYAEMFTAALESMAFFENDIRVLIENALKYIPEDCRVARSVKMVLEQYDKKTPWQEVRRMLVEDSADIGWFQAPANVAFTVLGLIYGEGDFKKSMIYSINCGDDTDCTGGTCGAVLGIIGGTKAIPEDWREYIGDKIITCSIDATYRIVPKSCPELTERVMKMIPTVLNANGVYMEYTDGEMQYQKEQALEVLKDVSKDFITRSTYSFEIGNVHTNAVVEYEKEPVISAGEELKIKITLHNKRYDPRYVNVNVITPENWAAEYPKAVFLSHYTTWNTTIGRQEFEIIIKAGESVQPVNNVTVILTSAEHPLPILIPLTILG